MCLVCQVKCGKKMIFVYLTCKYSLGVADFKIETFRVCIAYMLPFLYLKLMPPFCLIVGG